MGDSLAVAAAARVRPSPTWGTRPGATWGRPRSDATPDGAGTTWTGASARRSLRAALLRPAPSRLQSYQDEVELLEATARALADRPQIVAALGAARAQALELHAATASLLRAEAGLAERVERASRGD